MGYDHQGISEGGPQSLKQKSTVDEAEEFPGGDLLRSFAVFSYLWTESTSWPHW